MKYFLKIAKASFLLISLTLHAKYVGAGYITTSEGGKTDTLKTYAEAIYCSSSSKLLANVLPSTYPALSEWAHLFGAISITSRSDAASKTENSLNNVDREIENSSLKTANYIRSLGSRNVDMAFRQLISDTFEKCSSYASDAQLSKLIENKGNGFKLPDDAKL